MKLEDKLIELRKKSGFTQQEIAELLHVERSTYAGYETGKSTIPIKKIQLLAIIYNVDLNSFNTNDALILHAPDPISERKEEEEENCDLHLTVEERMMIANIRLIKAMGKSRELDEALKQLFDPKK